MLSTIFLYLLIVLSINIALFLVAYGFKSDKLTDISYALSFLTLDVAIIFNTNRLHTYGLILFLMVALWAIRIGGFLLIRVLHVGKDRRFDDMRGSFTRFGKFWVGQALTAWILMLPVALAEHNGNKVTTMAVVGLVVWSLGLVIEATADYQKYIFKRSLASKNKWIQRGLWKYARHPNYLGEILTWVGIYIYCFEALSLAEKILGLSSPGLIAVLLLFVSGVPLLEKSADKRWGMLPEYQTYKANTRLLIPIPARAKNR
jgi:steroid 5-alpha reductase family enzyme